MPAKTILGEFRLSVKDLGTLRGSAESVEAAGTELVYFTKTQRARYYTFRGVPGGKIQMLIQDDNLLSDQTHEWTIRAQIQKGRYDNHKRIVLVVRQQPKQRTCSMGIAAINIKEDGGLFEISIGHDLHFGPFQKLKSDLSGYKLSCIVMWHWSRYYQMIDREEAEHLANIFENTKSIHTMTLAEANRAASRLLYQTAVNNGWRKLTVREQKKHGVVGQWHRRDTLNPLKRHVSDYTEHASSGSVPIYSQETARIIACRWVAEHLSIPEIILKEVSDLSLVKILQDHKQNYLASSLLAHIPEPQ